ncbi:hypothetical protein ACSBPQ_06870 [Stenotrophomonas sp. JC08]|uniref:hypothetical protein n=1 Tax=Stenotrophomonas sp. JC08 TaxID=3445779 RepID=UPI003FA25B50
MEIQPSRQRLPDRFGPLSPRIPPTPEGLERWPVPQQLLPLQAYAAITRDDSIGSLPPAPQASWGEASISLPRRPSTSIVRRPRRVRIKLPWWWSWLCWAARIECRLLRCWQPYFQRPPHRHRRR